MVDVNPYASPQSYDAVPLVVESEPIYNGLFRKGAVLVMHKRATLPNRCIKSNEPAVGWLKRNLSWHHPAVFVALLANLLVYIILAMCLRKQATIYIGLSEVWFRKRRQATWIGWLLFLGGIAGLVPAIAYADTYFLAGLGIGLCPLAALGGAIYGLLAARLVWPERISDDYVWLKGAHPEFLASLPPWPYHP